MPAGSTMLDSVPEPAPQKPVAKRGSIFRDPVVRTMAFISAGIAALILVTVVSVLITGVAAPSGPRTLAEQQVAVAGAAVKEGSQDPADWGRYLSALIASGDYGLARDVIKQGRASINDTATADFSLAEARLLSAEKNYKGAIAAADKAMAQMKSYNDAQRKTGGLKAKTAVINGLPDNYYDAVLVKGYAYRDLKQWKDAIAQFDIYIGHTAGASDILVDRGNAKAAAGDTAGAEADFRTALKFVPDDAEALAGLKKIGATR